MRELGYEPDANGIWRQPMPPEALQRRQRDDDVPGDHFGERNDEES
jgi:hypothetical protein